YCTTERRKTPSSYIAIKRSCREKGILYEDPDFPAAAKSLYHHKKPNLSPIVWMRPHKRFVFNRYQSNYLSNSGNDSKSQRSVQPKNVNVIVKCRKVDQAETKRNTGNDLHYGDRMKACCNKNPEEIHGVPKQVLQWKIEICQRPRFIEEAAADSAYRFCVEAGELGDQWLLSAVASLALTPKFLERVVPSDQGFDAGHNYCGAFRKSSQPGIIKQGVPQAHDQKDSAIFFASKENDPT
ncbi:hypothetical protein YQE_08543, partial [Dendroctonus ponderosae]